MAFLHELRAALQDEWDDPVGHVCIALAAVLTFGLLCITVANAIGKAGGLVGL